MVLSRITLLFTFLFALGANQSLACSCSWNITIEDALVDAKQVFTGKAEDIEFIKTESQSYFLVKFKIKKFHVESGKEYKETLTIRTLGGAPSCGYTFKKGKTYLVYAYPHHSQNILRTTICSRNRRFGKRKEARLLKAHLTKTNLS